MSKPLTPDDVASYIKAQAEEKRQKALAPKSGAKGTEAITSEQLPARVKEKPEPNFGFRNEREFLFEVLKAFTMPHREFDRRLVGLYEPNVQAVDTGETIRKAVGSDEARAISDPYGGFLVPITFTPDLLKIDPEKDPIGSKTRNVPMASPTVKIPARVDKNHTSSVSGGLTVTRRPETVAGTSSQMQFEQVVLDAHTLFGLSYATEELLRDSPISFAALLSAGFSDQFAYHLIKERLYGSGVGEFLGVLTALDASSLGPTISVAKETGQEADTITYDNVLKMRSRCWGYDKAAWLANHDTMPQLMKLNQAVGTGGAVVWQPSAREDHPDILLGRPLFFTEYAKTLGDQGDLGIYNWSEYLEGTYQPLQNDESIHVRFVNHERTFKFWMRNAGQPWWKSALTPVYSSQKLSPFVVLDARA
jgi:HK97 family phage major capsid protein